MFIAEGNGNSFPLNLRLRGFAYFSIIHACVVSLSRKRALSSLKKKIKNHHRMKDTLTEEQEFSNAYIFLKKQALFSHLCKPLLLQCASDCASVFPQFELFWQELVDFCLRVSSAPFPLLLSLLLRSCPIACSYQHCVPQPGWSRQAGEGCLIWAMATASPSG